MKISVPDGNDPELMGFSTRLMATADSASYEFDFSCVQWTTPKWLVFVAESLNQFKNVRPNSARRAVNYHHLGYPAHMGFFKYFGVQWGLSPSQAEGSETYVPLTHIKVLELRRRAALAYRHPGEEVESEASKLASILVRTDRGDLHTTLTYSIREIMRNVIEHSGSESLTFAAQYWPAKNEVEVVVSDQGCGIYRSLKENPHLDINDSLTALQMSLLPGISSKAWRRARDDEWANSGYGLFMTHRLCGQSGRFDVISGENGIFLTAGAMSSYSTLFEGTMVVMRMRTEALADLSTRLKRFRDEGSEIARRIRGSDLSGPSVASLIVPKRR